MRFFEDLTVGEQRRSAPRDVTRDEILAFARQYDPQWFHADPDLAQGSAFGELVASGIHSLALWRQLDHGINGDIAWVCGVAWEETRWRHGLRAGAAVHAESEVLSLRASASTTNRGVARLRCALVQADGRTIVDFVSVNLVYTRASPQAALLEARSEPGGGG